MEIRKDNSQERDSMFEHRYFTPTNNISIANAYDGAAMAIRTMILNHPDWPIDIIYMEAWSLPAVNTYLQKLDDSAIARHNVRNMLQLGFRAFIDHEAFKEHKILATQNKQ